MKKILFVATVPEHFRYFHLPCFRMLKEHGYEVHTACSAAEEFPNTDKQFVVPMGRNPWEPKNIQGYKQLKKIIDEGEYDIVHCHTPVGGVLGRLCSRKARKRGTRVIYTAHGFHFYDGAPKLNWMIFYPIESFMSRFTDVLITINQEDYNRAKENFHAKKTAFVHGVGCDTTRYYKADAEERERTLLELGISPDATVVSYVAEQNANKAQCHLVQSAFDLSKKYPNLKMLIVGPDHIDGVYEGLAVELGAPVVFTGERHDVPRLLAASDLYAASSIREGLPVNIMEAMSAGLPVVARNNRGHRALVQDGVTGFLTSPEMQDKGITEKLDVLLSDKVLCEKMGEAGKEYIAAYDLQKVLAELAEIYFE